VPDDEANRVVTYRKNARAPNLPKNAPLVGLAGSGFVVSLTQQVGDEQNSSDQNNHEHKINKVVATDPRFCSLHKEENGALPALFDAGQVALQRRRISSFAKLSKCAAPFRSKVA
jgi:hypothetical protein